GGASIIVDNDDFEPVMKEMKENGHVSIETRRQLAAKAFSHTAYYDGLISTYFNRLTGRKFPDEYSLPLKSNSALRYGENPHQQATLYTCYNDRNISAVTAEV